MNFHKSQTQGGSIQEIQTRTTGKHKDSRAKSESKNEEQLARNIDKN